MTSTVVAPGRDGVNTEVVVLDPLPFDLDAAWRLHPQVSVRPERFGALLYHFGTRRLSFCKSRTLAAVIGSLAEMSSARSACLAAGVSAAELPIYRAALATLAASDTVVAREESR